MIKLYTALTKEIDDAAAAVGEIIGQLKPEENALKNTIGIVQFHHEFAETGVYQAIVEALPFEVVGCVSTFIGICGQYGDFSLSVTMLASDDVNFSIRTLEDLDTKPREQIFQEITALCTELNMAEKPRMVMSFMTPLQCFSGDDLVAAVNALPEPFLLFGTIAFNDENRRESNLVASGGKISPAMYAFVAFYGNCEPQFHVTTSFAYDDNFGDVAEITEADGPVLKTVNNVSALNFLKKHGMLNAENNVFNSSVWAVPAILTYKNGAKAARAFLGVVEGTDYIYSAGTLEVGAKISFASLDGAKTLSSVENMLANISAANGGNIIAYSCAARSWSLGSQYLLEVKKFAECAEKYRQRNGSPLHYCVSYAAGEICPVLNKHGTLVNTLHNYTLISCSFS